MVKLKKSDGVVVKEPIGTFSEEDQKFVLEQPPQIATDPALPQEGLPGDALPPGTPQKARVWTDWRGNKLHRQYERRQAEK